MISRSQLRPPRPSVRPYVAFLSPSSSARRRGRGRSRGLALSCRRRGGGRDGDGFQGERERESALVAGALEQRAGSDVRGLRVAPLLLYFKVI